MLNTPFWVSIFRYSESVLKFNGEVKHCVTAYYKTTCYLTYLKNIVVFTGIVQFCKLLKTEQI